MLKYIYIHSYVVHIKISKKTVYIHLYVVYIEISTSTYI